jgi:hypothetical protein
MFRPRYMNDGQMREVYQEALSRAEAKVLRAELNLLVIGNPDDGGLAEAVLEAEHAALSRLERHYSETAMAISREKVERRSCE